MSDFKSWEERADAAQASAQRFIGQHFRNKGERPRTSIPARPEHDDDLVLSAYIHESAGHIAQLEDEASLARVFIAGLAGRLGIDTIELVDEFKKQLKQLEECK